MIFVDTEIAENKTLITMLDGEKMWHLYLDDEDYNALIAYKNENNISLDQALEDTYDNCSLTFAYKVRE